MKCWLRAISPNTKRFLTTPFLCSHFKISRKTDVGETGSFAFSAKEGEQEVCFEIQMKDGVNYEYDPRQAQMSINLQVTEKPVPQKGRALSFLKLFSSE